MSKRFRAAQANLFVEACKTKTEEKCIIFLENRRENGVNFRIDKLDRDGFVPLIRLRLEANKIIVKY